MTKAELEKRNMELIKESTETRLHFQRLSELIRSVRKLLDGEG